jgi:hypothetical protein
VSHTQSGAEVIVELLQTNGTDCAFPSPIATRAPLWTAPAARRERGEPEPPSYFHCRHEMLAVAASGCAQETPDVQEAPPGNVGPSPLPLPRNSGLVHLSERGTSAGRSESGS